MIHSSLLSGISWLEHGFGTRLDAISQEEMASLRQIHSAITLVTNSIGVAGEGDALVTSTPGLPVSVRTADCYPILLADTKNRAIASVHAGWRGTAARILDAVLKVMAEQCGTQPSDIHAAIGPGIGHCCYEVGDDVAHQFGFTQRGCIDLAAANRTQLIEAGVPATQVEITGGCTRCDARQFHSYRRDKEHAGRMISYLRVIDIR